MPEMQVALVPFDDDVEGEIGSQLSDVAKVLQLHVRDHLRPHWRVSAAVSAKSSLDELGDDCFPVVIMGDPLPRNYHGFHLDMDGRPFALVHKDGEWSLTASHETIEMVCDPSGQRTLGGASELDEQGMVDYLVEVCDPCEDEGTDFEGVVVSDFVTPRYYEASPTERGGKFSHFGTITAPRQVLKGGYLSWRTRQPRISVWQKLGPNREDIKPLSGSPAQAPGRDSLTRTARDWVDTRRKRLSGAEATARNITGSTQPDAFRQNILDLLGDLGTPPPSLSDVIKLIERARQGYKPTEEDLARLNFPKDLALKGRTLDTVLNALKRQEKVAGLFGPDLLDPGFGSWLLALMP